MTRGEVVVRRVDAVLATAPPPSDWMSAGELARAARLRVPARHACFVAGHWLLRQLLARGFGGAARDHVLVERENLPPALAGSDLRVSLSHGGDWVAAAWSRAAIGIDLEPRQPRAALARLQHLLLNPDEPPDSLSDDALLRRWVLKEALLKRDHGSALPASLQALPLYPAAGGSGEVVLLGSADWYLAVAPASVDAVDAGQPLRSLGEWSPGAPMRDPADA